jgi:hypothetical protein
MKGFQKEERSLVIKHSIVEDVLYLNVFALCLTASPYQTHAIMVLTNRDVKILFEDVAIGNHLFILWKNLFIKGQVYLL